MDAAPAGHAAHAIGLASADPLVGDSIGLFALLLHTGGYLLVAAIVAGVVYHKLGLKLLRTAWINLDLIWAGALLLTAVSTPRAHERACRRAGHGGETEDAKSCPGDGNGPGLCPKVCPALLREVKCERAPG